MLVFFFFFKQKTAYEMRISDWSSDVCSSDLSGLQLPSRGKQAIGDRAQHYVDRDEEGDGSRHRMRHRRIHRPDAAIAKTHDSVIHGLGVRDRLKLGRQTVDRVEVVRHQRERSKDDTAPRVYPVEYHSQTRGEARTR